MPPSDSRVTKLEGQYLQVQGSVLAYADQPVFQLYLINESNEIGVSISTFVKLLNIKPINRDPEYERIKQGMIKSKEYIATIMQLKDLCANVGNVASMLMRLLLGLLRPTDPPSAVAFAKSLVSSLTSEFAPSLQKFIDMLPMYVEQVKSSPGSRDLILELLLCCKKGLLKTDSFWYESACSTIQSKHIPSIHSLRYSAVEHRVWDLGWMVGPEFVRILRGHRTGPKPEDNFTNLAIPNQRDSKRHVNSKAKELAVHSESIDLSTAIELLKERHEQGHKQAFMVLSADAIYAGKVKLVPECINGSIIGAVDKHGSKSVYDIEDDLACLDKRVHCLIESLAWKRITDIYHPKEPENAKHDLKLALNFLRRYRTELLDAVIPDAKQSVKLLEKKLQAKSRTISTTTTIPGVEDETGGRDECSSGSESDCEEDNLSIHTGPNDENLRGSMLAEQSKAINHQKTKSVAILMEKLAIWNGFLKNATETSSTLTELVAQLDENIFEIGLRGIPQNLPCYCHDLNKWEASPFPSSSHWRKVLEAVLKNALKLQQDWTLLQLPPADHVLAVALADSTGAKSTIVCHRAISKTDAKSITFALFLEIIHQFFEASGEIVRCITFDMEHVSQIGEPIKGEGFSLYRSLVQATRTQIQTGATGFSPIEKSFYHFSTSVTLLQEYVKLCHLVDNLTPPSIAACISWLRLNKSYPGAVRMDTCDIYLFHKEFTSAVKARNLPWSCLPAHGNRQVSAEMEELIEWCGHQNPSLHKTQWKSQLTNLARDCGSFFLDLQQVQTGANSEFVSALLTSLNVELYCPIPHPLKATKKLFINPDYDHLICKNFIRRACDSNFMDMQSGLQCIFEAGWFARDPMDVKLGHEAFLPETAEQLRAKGFHDAAKVSKIIGDFYDALDCRGISDQERIASARKVVSWIHEVFGADLRKDPCRGKYNGLPWQVILPLLVLARNFILLCEEVVAESIGRSTETTVVFVGRAVFASNYVEQHFNWSRVADRKGGQGRVNNSCTEGLKLACNKAGVIQDFLIDESLSSTFVVGLNNANNTYISKGSTSKLSEWNVQIEKAYPVPSFLKKHLLPIPQCIQTPNPSGVVPPLPNILSESSNVVNIPHVRALAIAYSHNVSVSAPPSESQKRKATDILSKSRRKILGNSNK
ncbi:hypothetical protein BDR26DRAFT_914491 [Obelidium mucronatum]|nr:hypothetical protein BDR26DRAFT_914491 [Obelidium mucronatum]